MSGPEPSRHSFITSNPSPERHALALSPTHDPRTAAGLRLGVVSTTTPSHARTPSDGFSAKTDWTADTFNNTISDFPRPPSALPTPRTTYYNLMATIPGSPRTFAGSSSESSSSRSWSRPGQMPIPRPASPGASTKSGSSILFEPAFLATLFDPPKSPMSSRPPPSPMFSTHQQARLSKSENSGLYPSDVADSFPLRRSPGGRPFGYESTQIPYSPALSQPRVSNDTAPLSPLPPLPARPFSWVSQQRSFASDAADENAGTEYTASLYAPSKSEETGAIVHASVQPLSKSVIGVAPASYTSVPLPSDVEIADRKLRRPAADGLSKLKIVSYEYDDEHGPVTAPHLLRSLPPSTPLSPYPLSAPSYIFTPDESGQLAPVVSPVYALDRQPSPKRLSVPDSVKSRVSSVFTPRRSKSIRSAARAPYGVRQYRPPMPPLPVDVADQYNIVQRRSKLLPTLPQSPRYADPFDDRAGYMHEKAVRRKNSLKSTRSVFTMWSERSRRVGNGVAGFARLRASETSAKCPSRRPVSRHPKDEMTESQRIRESVYPQSVKRWGITHIWRKRMWWLAIIVLVATILAIILGAVLGSHHHARHAASSGSTATGCPGNSTGVRCDLDATCVCTTSGASCAPLSQTLLSLVPYTSQLFGIPINAHNLSLQIWDLQGSPVHDCSSQSLLVDVGQSLNASTSPVRTLWARSTLLYTLITSNNVARTSTLKTFISALNFTTLSTIDGVSHDASADHFIFKDSTFSFNYASLDFTVPKLPSASASNSASPTSRAGHRRSTYW